MPDLLRSLHAQTLPADAFEIVVVDDASDDDTAEVAARGGARVIRQPVNAGSYAARNAGIEQTEAPVLAFTDADCRPTPTWLEHGLAALGEAAELVAGRIAVPVAPGASVAGLLDSVRFLDQERYVTFGWGATANLLVRRSLLERIGPFDARLRSGGDMDFGTRASRAGTPPRYAHDAVVEHENRDSVREVVRKAYRIGRGVMARHRAAHGRRSALRAALAPGSVLPRRGFPGSDRLPPLSPVRRLQVHAAEYVLVRLPMTAGRVAASLGRPRPTG
jgi:glycosyltransferase involved in cell wall biosynthesis